MLKHATRAATRASDALPVNIGSLERLATALGGGLLAAYGLRKGRSGIPLALLGGAVALRGAAGRCPIYRLIGLGADGSQAVQVEHAITVNAEPARLYAFWRDFENLPRIMPRLEEVRVLDDRRSRWVAKAPAGAKVEWEAELIEDNEPHLIAWRALPGKAQIWNAGKVNFAPAPGGRGTEVRVQLEYAPPAGRLGQTLARLAGEEPAIQVADSLRRLKMIFEAGEVATSAMRPDQDWEQGNQPWHQQGDDDDARVKEVGR